MNCFMCNGKGKYAVESEYSGLVKIICHCQNAPMFNDYIHGLPLTGAVSEETQSEKKSRSRTRVHRKAGKRNKRIKSSK